MDKAVTRITRTALFTALLVALQAATLPFGNTLVTGSVVNLLLILAALFLDLPAAAAVGLLSPAVAKFLGIGPLWALIPFIALGNLVLIFVWRAVVHRWGQGWLALGGAALLVSPAKTATLYLGIVQFAIPILLKLPPQQAAAVSALFSLPQLVTALVGGTAAVALFPVLRRAVPEPTSRS